jgi:zinc metalloprotease ZmpB
MELRVEMSAALSSRGWRLDVGDANFRLKPGEKRKIILKLNPGSAFAPDDIRGAGPQDINVYLHGNGILLGGMTYRVDPDLREPSGAAGPNRAPVARTRHKNSSTASRCPAARK